MIAATKPCAWNQEQKLSSQASCPAASIITGIEEGSLTKANVEVVVSYHPATDGSLAWMAAFEDLSTVYCKDSCDIAGSTLLSKQGKEQAVYLHHIAPFLRVAAPASAPRLHMATPSISATFDAGNIEVISKSEFAVERVRILDRGEAIAFLYKYSNFYITSTMVRRP